MTLEQTQPSVEGYLAQLAEFLAIVMVPGTVVLMLMPDTTARDVLLGIVVIVLAVALAFILRQREADDDDDRKSAELKAGYKLLDGRIAGLEREGVPSSLCAELREMMSAYPQVMPGTKFVPELDALLTAKGKKQFREPILRAMLITWQPVLAEKDEAAPEPEAEVQRA